MVNRVNGLAKSCECVSELGLKLERLAHLRGQ